jgi:esterase/lipase superfamily enzyme
MSQTFFLGEIHRSAEAAADADLFLYIHGYNVGFEEAAIRAAQLGCDLKAKSTMFFSWPSRSKLQEYL